MTAGQEGSQQRLGPPEPAQAPLSAGQPCQTVPTPPWGSCPKDSGVEARRRAPEAGLGQAGQVAWQVLWVPTNGFSLL